MPNIDPHDLGWFLIQDSQRNNRNLGFNLGDTGVEGDLNNSPILDIRDEQIWGTLGPFPYDPEPDVDFYQ